MLVYAELVDMANLNLSCTVKRHDLGTHLKLPEVTAQIHVQY